MMSNFWFVQTKRRNYYSLFTRTVVDSWPGKSLGCLLPFKCLSLPKSAKRRSFQSTPGLTSVSFNALLALCTKHIIPQSSRRPLIGPVQRISCLDIFWNQIILDDWDRMYYTATTQYCIRTTSYADTWVFMQTEGESLFLFSFYIYLYWL